MTKEEKKRCMQRYADLSRQVFRTAQEVRGWEALAGTAQCSEALCVAEELHRDVKRMSYMRLEIKKALDSLQDERLQLLMSLRYIDGLTWEQVADRMHMDYRWIHRLHNRALEQLAIESHGLDMI